MVTGYIIINVYHPTSIFIEFSRDDCLYKHNVVKITSSNTFIKDLKSFIKSIPHVHLTDIQVSNTANYNSNIHFVDRIRYEVQQLYPELFI
jgi:hypothetical protein